jgi:predicted amidohydrolase YtcJ
MNPQPADSSLLVIGRIFTADPEMPWAEAVLVEGDTIAYVGSTAEARRLAPFDVATVETAGAVVPGFVDGHAHLLMSGSALLQAQLRACQSLDDIQDELLAWQQQNPDTTRVLGIGWLFSAVPDGSPTRQMLDTIAPDVPVYLSAADLHSVWVNTKALEEMGIEDTTPDVVGGRIVRDKSGAATGLLLETAAIEFAWPVINRASDDESDRHLQAIIGSYLAAGTTTAVDMAVRSDSLGALLRADAQGRLPFTVVGHWLVHRSGDSEEEVAQVRLAAEHAARHTSGRVRINGIKLILDGTIDGCTAAVIDPYALQVGGGDGDHGDTGELIWPREALDRVVAAADEAGLQIAMHAIGDRAVRTALDSFEVAAAQRFARNDTRERRHRIEHLEYVDEADVARLAPLGITASMQPVHCDPAILKNWIAVLGGDHRTERGFAWPEYLAAGTTLVFGTDTPTANHEALPNMFIAATRRSPVDTTLPAYVPSFALPLDEAVGHATRDAAWASFLELERGVLRAGLAADLVLLDRDPFAEGPESMLSIRVQCTVVGGQIAYSVAAD